MASKQEIKDIELAIEDNRVRDPAKANGLILALAIVNDDHDPEFIEIDEPESNQFIPEEKMRISSWPKGDYVLFNKGVLTSYTGRGREVLTDMPIAWLISTKWERLNES